MREPSAFTLAGTMLMGGEPMKLATKREAGRL